MNTTVEQTWYAEGKTLKSRDDETIAIGMNGKAHAANLADTLNEYKTLAEARHADVLDGWRAGHKAHYIGSEGQPTCGVVDCVMLFRDKITLFFGDDEDGVDAVRCERTEAALYRREIDRHEAMLEILRNALTTLEGE
jgi:hypothetical protein